MISSVDDRYSRQCGRRRWDAPLGRSNRYRGWSLNVVRAIVLGRVWRHSLSSVSVPARSVRPSNRLASARYRMVDVRNCRLRLWSREGGRSTVGQCHAHGYLNTLLLPINSSQCPKLDISALPVRVMVYLHLIPTGDARAWSPLLPVGHLTSVGTAKLIPGSPHIDARAIWSPGQVQASQDNDQRVKDIIIILRWKTMRR